ncbi:MAG: ComEA family DNA-binding protein [Defluviitaleaceae bacterium]|nr:ComEA family DNA-binding protein [Defluviitaleaceae bacterium]
MQNSILDHIKRHAFFILGGACLVAVGIIFVLIRQPGAEVMNSVDSTVDIVTEADTNFLPEPMIEPEPEPILEPESIYIAVHVVGAVNAPGVVELREGLRVVNALELAGGAREDADLTRINLATVLHDAMQIIVPAYNEVIEEVFIFSNNATPQTSADAAVQAHSGLININTASAIELQTLPGVGPVLSQNIINFREANGGFTSVEQLIHVPRIGASTLDRLRDLVTID